MSQATRTDEFVCVGRFRATDKKVYLRLHRVNDLGTNLNFADDKLTKGLRAGQVYNIGTSNEGKTFHFGTRSWVRQFEDQAKVLEWQAAEKAISLSEEARKLEAREGTSTSGLEKALEPIRMAYERLPYPQRAAFEVYVLSVLRRKS